MSYFPYKIYCDMDGVLCDFEKGAVDLINEQLSSQSPRYPKLAAKIIEELGRDYIKVDDIQKYSPGKSRAASKYMYIVLQDDEDFWSNLPWQPGGKRLWAYIRQYDPDILTSPMDKGGKNESLSGKLTWVENNLGLSPEKVKFAHDKWKFAVSNDGEPNILIDDFESKTKPFTEAGGIGVLHINADNTIRILEVIEQSDETP